MKGWRGEGRGKREEGRGKREEGRGKREEGRGKREEGRGKREEGRGVGCGESKPRRVKLGLCGLGVVWLQMVGQSVPWLVGWFLGQLAGVRIDITKMEMKIPKSGDE